MTRRTGSTLAGIAAAASVAAILVPLFAAASAPSSDMMADTKAAGAGGCNPEGKYDPNMNKNQTDAIGLPGLIGIACVDPASGQAGVCTKADVCEATGEKGVPTSQQKEQANNGNTANGTSPSAGASGGAPTVTKSSPISVPPNSAPQSLASTPPQSGNGSTPAQGSSVLQSAYQWLAGGQDSSLLPQYQGGEPNGPVNPSPGDQSTWLSGADQYQLQTTSPSPELEASLDETPMDTSAQTFANPGFANGSSDENFGPSPEEAAYANTLVTAPSAADQAVVTAQTVGTGIADTGGSWTESALQYLQQSQDEQQDYLTTYGVCYTAGGCNPTEGAPTTYTAHPDENGVMTNDIYTLDGYALGDYPYVTVAGARDQQGDTGVIPQITYTDPWTNQTQTLYNVPYMVADTGSSAYFPNGNSTVSETGGDHFDVPIAVPPSEYPSVAGSPAAMNSLLDTQPFNGQVASVVPTNSLAQSYAVADPWNSPATGGLPAYSLQDSTAFPQSEVAWSGSGEQGAAAPEGSVETGPALEQPYPAGVVEQGPDLEQPYPAGTMESEPLPPALTEEQFAAQVENNTLQTEYAKLDAQAQAFNNPVMPYVDTSVPSGEEVTASILQASNQSYTPLADVSSADQQLAPISDEGQVGAANNGTTMTSDLFDPNSVALGAASYNPAVAQEITDASQFSPAPTPGALPEDVPLPEPRPSDAGALGIDLAGCGGVCEYNNAGADVTAIQQFLDTQGYGVSVDGIYGSQTENAVEAFQQSQHIADDGIVGPQTLASMNAVAQAGSNSGDTSPGGTAPFTGSEPPPGSLQTQTQQNETVPLPEPRPANLGSAGQTTQPTLTPMQQQAQRVQNAFNSSYSAYRSFVGNPTQQSLDHLVSSVRQTQALGSQFQDPVVQGVASQLGGLQRASWLSPSFVASELAAYNSQIVGGFRTVQQALGQYLRR